LSAQLITVTNLLTTHTADEQGIPQQYELCCLTV
jgi:hypothetical protein